MNALMDAPTTTCKERMDGEVAIRAATDADNEALLALTRVTPMEGRIALRIDREPDFFALLRRRGAAIVFVATCESQVIGSISAAVHPAYVHGALEKVAHIGDLKVHPRFAGRRLSSRLMSALECHLKEAGVDLCVALIAEGNRRMTPICAGRDGLPAGVPLGRFVVQQLIARPARRRPSRYPIEEAAASDLPAVAALLDGIYRERQFAPRVSVEELSSGDGTRSCETAPACRLVARDGGRLVATLALEDTYALRQNILIGAPRTVRWAMTAARPLGRLLPQLSIPRLGGPIRTLYVRHMACSPDGVDALRLLLDDARGRAFRHGFTFLSVGLHERDPLRRAVDGGAGITFHSLAVVGSLLTQGRLANLNSQIPYEDFALV